MQSPIKSHHPTAHAISNFKPSWWCQNNHAQTLWPILSRRSLMPSYQREQMRLDDGDFIYLDWLGPNHQDAPITIIFHGLEGSSQSHYVRTLSTLLAKNHIRSCVMHFRGCGGAINLRPRGYHGGETHDPDFVIKAIQKRYPDNTIFAVGYSLGAGVLLKWLGEQRNHNPIKAAVAVAAPFDLAASAKQVERGVSKIYQYWLLKHMKNTVRKKANLLASLVNVPDLLATRTLRAFDDIGTAPMHGFRDAGDYYLKASCRNFLRNILTPVLIVQAIDDPLICPKSIPDLNDLGPGITLELSRRGGHIGFVGKSASGPSKYWLDNRIIEYLKFVDSAPSSA